MESQGFGDRAGYRYGGFRIVAVAPYRLCGRNGYGHAFPVGRYRALRRIHAIQGITVGERAFDGTGKSRCTAGCQCFHADLLSVVKQRYPVEGK